MGHALSAVTLQASAARRPTLAADLDGLLRRTRASGLRVQATLTAGPEALPEPLLPSPLPSRAPSLRLSGRGEH